MSDTYDFKIVEFPNGTYEIRIYDEPISKLDEKENYRRQVKRSKTIANRINAIGKELVYVPFEDEELEVVDLYDVQADEIRKRKNARDSYRRTVNKIHDLARCEKWTMFYTLTFSPSVVDREDFGACMKKARTWFNNIRKFKCVYLKYLIIPELHSDNKSWHIHGLVCGDDEMTYVDSGRRDNSGRIIYNIDNWKFGFSTATKIEDTHKVSSYVLKYITKDLCERSLGQRRYYRSNNLQKPRVSTYLSSQVFDDDYVHNIENLETLLSSIGCDNVTRIKKVSSEYCSVTYVNAD